MSRAIDDVWKRKLHAGQIDPATFKAETDFLIDGLKQSLGDPLTMMFTDTKLDVVQAMRRNVFTFVAFKNHSRTADIVGLLTDEKGKLRSKSDFITRAREISTDYNKNWLAAEYETVVASGQTAAQWHDFQSNKEFLPYLIYKTQADSRVRDSHNVLHDVCKPVDDDFWDEYYPPNGWRCRCYVLQVAKQEGIDEPERLPDAEEVKPIFRNNPGKSGVIFTDDHPYFSGVDKSTRKNVLHQMRSVLAQEDIYDLVYESPLTGRSLQAHITHDGAERSNNIALGILIADLNWSGKLLPVVRGVKGKRNPDYMRNDGELMEFKTIDGRWSVKNAIKDALNKNADLHQVVFNVVAWNRGHVSSQLWEQFKRREQLHVVWIILEGQMYMVRRDQLKDDLARLPK